MSDHKFIVVPQDKRVDSIAQGIVKALMELQGRSFEIEVIAEGERVRIRATNVATDSEFWTVFDVAAYTQQMPDKILRWCQTRHRQQAMREGRTPIPFRKLDAKTVMFDRKKVMDWWSNVAEPVIPTFTKGKRVPKKR